MLRFFLRRAVQLGARHSELRRPRAVGHVRRLEEEGDIAADYLEELLDITLESGAVDRARGHHLGHLIGHEPDQCEPAERDPPAAESSPGFTIAGDEVHLGSTPRGPDVRRQLTPGGAECAGADRARSGLDPACMAGCVFGFLGFDTVSGIMPRSAFRAAFAVARSACGRRPWARGDFADLSWSLLGRQPMRDQVSRTAGRVTPGRRLAGWSLLPCALLMAACSGDGPSSATSGNET